MAQAPTQDFIVKSGLNVLGTATVTSSTGNTSTLQVDGGAAVAKNLIVGTDAEVRGNLTVYGSIPYLTITTGTFTDLTVTSLSTLNAVTAGVTTASQLDVASRLLVGGLSQFNNATLASQTNSTSSTTGALQVAGGVGIQKDLWVGGRVWANGYEVVTTATILANTLEEVATKGSSTTVAISILNTTSSISTNTGALTVTGGVGVGGDIYANAIYDSNNRVVTSVIASGSTYIGIVNLTSSGTTASFTVVNLGVQTLTAGTDTAVSSNTGTVTVWNYSTLDSVSTRGSTTTNAIHITNTTPSISTTTGALIVDGGVGIGGALYATSLYINTASYINDSLVLTTATVDLYASKTIIIAGTDTAVNTSSGIVTVWNESTLQTITDRGAVSSNAVSITNNTSAISTDSGALQVTGGVGVGGNLHVGGTIYGTLVGAGSITTATNISGGTAGQVPYQASPGVTNFYGPGTAGNVLVSNGASAPSYNNTLTLTSTLSNTTTVAGNALQVVGGVGIDGSLFVNGPAYFLNNVVFSGTSTSILSTTTVYTDNYIELHFPSGGGEAGVWTVDDGKDIGHIYHHYKDATGDEHGALIWHNLSDELRWYMGGVELNTSTQVWDVSTATFGVFRTGTLLLQNTTTATSTSTGTLVVAGGVGIGGNLYVGGTSVLRVVNATSATFSGTLGVTGTSTLGVLNATTATFSGLTTVTNVTSATSTTTGALQVRGGIGVGGEIWSKGAVHILDSTPAGASQGALFVSGGVTIGIGLSLAGSYNQVGNFQTTGLSTLTNVTSATSTSTGALQVRGGVGIGGALYVQQTSFINGSQILTAATIGSFGVSTITAGTDTAVSASTGGVVIWNTSTLQSVTNRGSVTTNAVSITNSTSATSTTTGALTVVGGVGVGRKIIAGSDIVTNAISHAAYSPSYQSGLSGVLVTGTNIVNLVSGTTVNWVPGMVIMPQYNDPARPGRFNLSIRSTEIKEVVSATQFTVYFNHSVGGQVDFEYGHGYFGAGGTLYGERGNVKFGTYAGDSAFISSRSSNVILQPYGDFYSGNPSEYITQGVGVEIVPGNLVFGPTTVDFNIGLTSIDGNVTAGNVNFNMNGNGRVLINSTRTATAGNAALHILGGVLIGDNLRVLSTSTLRVLNATSATFSGTLGVTGTSVLGVVHATSATFSGTLGVTGTSTLGVLNATTATFSGVTTVTNITSATSTTTGALQVRGGVGIGGALYVQRTSYINDAEILTTATIGSFGISSIAAGTDTVVSTSTGAVTIWNTSTLQSVTNRGAATTNAISITNTTSSISTTTGALQVRGGVGVSGSVYVGNRVGFVNTSNVSAVYQVYNAVTNSLDTVFA